MGESQGAVNFPGARGGSGPPPGPAPPPPGVLKASLREARPGAGAGTLGGKRNPQQVGAGYIMSVYDDWVLIVCWVVMGGCGGQEALTGSGEASWGEA